MGAAQRWRSDAAGMERGRHRYHHPAVETLGACTPTSSEPSVLALRQQWNFDGAVHPGGSAVPFAAVHLLFINLLMDSLPAIAGSGAAERDVMLRPCPSKAGNSTKRFPYQRGCGRAALPLPPIVAFHIGLPPAARPAAPGRRLQPWCLSRPFHGFTTGKIRPPCPVHEAAFFDNRHLLRFAVGDCLGTRLDGSGAEPLVQRGALSAMNLGTIVGLAFGSMVCLFRF